MTKRTMEINAVLLNLNKAIDTHYQWLVSMPHGVVARDAGKPEIMNNHSYELCQFGRWTNHLGPLDNDELPYVRLMDSTHQHMHNCGRELMLAVIENHWQDTHFDAFQEGLPFSAAALTDYRAYLLTTRSSMDVLMGLPGRRVLDESFGHQLHSAGPLNLYLVLLDTDQFRLVNNTYGHLIGDVVLHTLTTYSASRTCGYETVYRYGDEEFIIIVKATNDREACRVGIRTYQSADNHTVTRSEGHIDITMTAGVSRAFPGEPLDVATGRADRAIYEGRQTGRNRCMFIGEQNVIN